MLENKELRSNKGVIWHSGVSDENFIFKDEKDKPFPDENYRSNFFRDWV